MLIQQFQMGMGGKQSPQLYIYPNQMSAQGAQPFQQQHVNIQQQLPYDYPPQPALVVNEGPKQVQHREAYVRYIANLKRTHQVQNSPAANNPIANAAQIQQSDWFSALDVRVNKIREKRVQAPSLAWIENCPSDDILQHLVSLRYGLLSDALNVRKEANVLGGEEEEVEKEVDKVVNVEVESASEAMVVE